MKVTKSRAIGSKQLKYEPKNINNNKQLIMSNLLEKYKPKNLFTAKDKSQRIKEKRTV